MPVSSPQSTRHRKRKRSDDSLSSPPSKRQRPSYNNENQDISNHIATLKCKISSEFVVKFEYEADFDENGFIFYLGTNGKTCNTFKNPADSKLVKVTTTPLFPNSASKNHLVDRKLVRLISKSLRDASFIIDFSNTKYEISPTNYTLRHYKSWDNEALRNWSFCGSNDGIQWTLIKQHVNDTSLRTKGQSFTWQISNCAQYYSLFRIQLCGPNCNNNFYLACSGFEIYGNVRKQTDCCKTNSDCDSDIEILTNSTSKKQTHNDRTNDKQLQQALNTSNELDICPKDTLLSMGYNEYMVNECMKYVQNRNTNDILSKAIDWLNMHQMTHCEKQNNNIMNLCTIIECPRYKALYALKQSDNKTEEALDILMKSDAEPLSSEQIANLRTEDAIISATLISIQDKRKKDQQFIAIKPLIISELRSMGFLQIAVQKAVNDPSVNDRKSAIQYILSHPMNRNQESDAKIKEIMNSGYTHNDAVTSLNRYAQNLKSAMLWLMQQKPAKIKHFIYHVESKKVLQISREQMNHKSSVELCEDIRFKNENQHWTFYENGKMKNFANNEILVVSKQENRCDIEYKLEVIHDTKEQLTVSNVWEMDENEKTIKHKEYGLFLVYRNRFNLEKKLHCGDLAQRWCFVDYSELTKLNPKELSKSLDSQEFECVICWENEPNVRLEPCGHSVFCRKCINELNPSQCPICRTQINTTQHVAV